MKLAVLLSNLLFFTNAKLSSAQTDRPRRVALVTGANKGIGKEIARRLGSELGVVVVMGCRDIQLGLSAANELTKSGCNVIFHRLDLTDNASVESVRQFILHEYGQLDILVNNAAICFNDPTLYGKCGYTSFRDQAEPTLATNFFGTLHVTQALLPILRLSTSPRIVNVASAAGRLSILRSKEKLDAFTSTDLELNGLQDLISQFEYDVKTGKHLENGWPNTCYGMSKLGVIAMTKILARAEPSIMINSVDPGYCKTDQNANQGTLPVEFGARTPVWLSLLPNQDFITGSHFFDQKKINW